MIDGDKIMAILALSMSARGKLAENTLVATVMSNLGPVSYTHLDVYKRQDMGDHVIIINAEKIVLTANKASKKKYYDHSGYPGGRRTTSFEEMLGSKPERVVESAIRGMLPKNSLGRDQFRKLKVYAGAEHPHAAQQPTTYAIGQVAQ